jgi:Mrp family chromosome partitioning ATPase
MNTATRCVRQCSSPLLPSRPSPYDPRYEEARTTRTEDSRSPDARHPITEADVRAALASPHDHAPVQPEEIADIATEPGWLSVTLAIDAPSRQQLRRTHARLVAAFPETDAELRVGKHIYRGGAGWGDGRHVVAVLGGKGGVGKSTVSVNLALTLSAMGVSVGLLDCDINAPDIPHMLGVHMTEAPKRRNFRLSSSSVLKRSERAHPEQRYGLEVMSVGFLAPERFAPRITSRVLVHSMLRGLVYDLAWSADVLIIDAPPGTGEELQVIAGELPLSGALFVTTPQDLAQMDAERTLALLTEHDVPVIGLVKNMASMACPHCDERIDMFAQSDRLVSAGVSIIGEIPFDVSLSVNADVGVPLVLAHPRGPVAYEFAKIATGVRRWLAEREIASLA